MYFLGVKIKSMATFVIVSQDTQEKYVTFVYSLVPVVHVVEENVWKKVILSSVNVLQTLVANFVKEVYDHKVYDIITLLNSVIAFHIHVTVLQLLNW